MIKVRIRWIKVLGFRVRAYSVFTSIEVYIGLGFLLLVEALTYLPTYRGEE